MSDKPVTVATFVYLPKAETARVGLEAAGITVFLADAEIVNTDGFLSNAVGSVKLQVPPEQADEARRLLEEMRAATPKNAGDDDDDDTADKCLACGAEMPEEDDTCPECGWSYGESTE